MSSKNNSELKNNPDYLIYMKNAGSEGKLAYFLRLLPVVLFTAITITIVRLHIYYRPMSRFYWTDATDYTAIPDLFSYNKMRFIIIVACLSIGVLLYQLITRQVSIKRSSVYFPMVIYSLFIVISYIGSDYKEFSLLGFNERFEGTLPLLCYMVMLFFTINTINTEKDLKVLLVSVAIVSGVLCILGVAQATGHDFFNTLLGQKLLTPNYTLADGSRAWTEVENSFNQGELFYSFDYGNNIYQTVYNQNYVSFYLTLLIPVFGLLFIRSLFNGSDEPVWKKVLLGVLCALLIYNLIGAASSGGFFGLGIVIVLAVVVLIRQIRLYWKPCIILVVAIVLVLGITKDRWIEEVKNTVSYMRHTVEYTPANEGAEYGSVRPWIDYIKTGEGLEFSINGNALFIDFGENEDSIWLAAFDSDNNKLGMTLQPDGYYSIDDERFFPYAKIIISQNSMGQTFLNVKTALNTWVFHEIVGRLYYINVYGKGVTLTDIKHIGFKNNPSFGTGRGYIWSTTLPLLKNTIIKGFGADTFCAVFPQNDYAYRYSARIFDYPIVIDKPHNMYLHIAVGTGIISLIALLIIYGIYVVQSMRLFWNREFKGDYLLFAGFGLFCGLTAFMISGLVEDSSVSVMPMFYGLLGTGIAVNLMIKKKYIQDNK